MSLFSSRILARTIRTPRTGYACPQCRHYAVQLSSEAPAPPLLIALRTDLKTAMREKDTNRLNVLRALLAEVTNAAKTNAPIKTDMQLLSLVRKRSAAAKAASGEFKAAGREDLVQREEEQARVLEEYAGSVKTIPESEIRSMVNNVVVEVKAQSNGKVNAGEIMKKLLAPGGILDGKPVEKAEVAKVVKGVLAQP